MVSFVACHNSTRVDEGKNMLRSLPTIKLKARTDLECGWGRRARYVTPDLSLKLLPLGESARVVRGYRVTGACPLTTDYYAS